MQLDSKRGELVTYKASVPVRQLGNFRVTGRISTSANRAAPNWQWASDSGVRDLRFRPRAVENEALSEQVVHIGLANSDGNNISTLRDLIDPTMGKYNLWAIKAAGKNAIRLQPPFRADRWDLAHPYDTLGSPYAATDFFAIDARYSRDVQQRNIPPWDKDGQRKVANAEFWAVVDKAHELGLKVILDIALNHTGHNTTIRDLFDDPVVGERVLRNNFDQLVVNPQQLDAIHQRLAKNPNGTGEQLFPEMFASRHHEPLGAHSLGDMVGGGNGEWADTKQLNHGSFNWGANESAEPINQSVTDWYTRILKYWVDPPANEPGGPKGAKRGVDGFRFDHATNLPTLFWERSLTQLQAMVDKPVVVISEDFNQGEKLAPYADAMESGWYKDVIDKFKGGDVEGIHGIIDSDLFHETLRGGNHDEARVSTLFDGDLNAVGRYLSTIELLGGISTTVMGDEFGERQKEEFKHQGGVPPVLAQSNRQQLGQPSIQLQQTLARAGRAKASDASLQTALRTPLRPIGRGINLLGEARHADDRNLPGTLLFVNLANADERSNVFPLDPETSARIDPKGRYQAVDLMSDRPEQELWERRALGRESCLRRESTFGSDRTRFKHSS